MDSLNGLQAALGLDTLPVRIECFDISHVGGTHTVASMVVFEGGAPKKSDYRRFTIREVDGGDDFGAMAEVLSRRYAQWEKQAERSPYDADRDASFAALPEPRRDRRRQGPARRRASSRCRASASAAWPSSRWPSGSRRSSLPGDAEPRSCCPHDTPELQLLQRVRDEAHRFAITHHRIRRDKAMTESIMDELPGIGPARKRALLKHFGSPEAVLGASREDLENVPGFPQKVARDLYAHLNQTGR